MNSYKTEDKNYSATIEVAASPGEIFNSVNNVSAWWVKKEFKGKFQGNSEKLNDEFEVWFGEAHYSKQKLVEVIPDRKVVWLVTESKLTWIPNDETEWTNTKIIFEVTPKGKGALLKFTHEGLVPQQACYDKCVQGWDMLVKQNLYNIITKENAKSVV